MGTLVAELRSRVESYADAHPGTPPADWLYREIDAWAADRDARWRARSARRAGPLAIVPEPTCRVGCDHCCYQHVAVTEAEAAILAEHVRRAWPAEEVGALRSRLEEGEAAIRRIEAGEATEGGRRRALGRLRRPCPMLDERLGACRAYEARPVNCRRENSVEVEVCRRYREDPDATDSSLRLVRYDVIWGAARAFLARYGAGHLDAGPGDAWPLDRALLLALGPGGPAIAGDDGAADDAVEP